MEPIKCLQCGSALSNPANFCVHCGCPINVTTVSPCNEGTVVIHGIKQGFLIGGTMDIYLDGQYYGSVKKDDSLEIKIAKDTEITARCGINVLKGKYLAKVGKIQKLQIVYNRWIGAFTMQEIDASNSNSNN